ncbi:MAG TPA: C4-type zinc ribbon domain-containing protein [Jiangellaceae bacterium]|nr:C4-type zinc ribbon domain-containing protein [Jiangellaceae bacterium]
MDHAHRTPARGGEPPLNADPAAQQRLLDLQAVDHALGQLAYRRNSLPEVAELAALAAEHMKLRDAGVAVTTEIADLDREERRADADVEQVRQRKDRDLRRLDNGQVSSPKELENLQSEIASLERRQSVLEEAELDVMERLEEARKRSSHLETEREDVGRRAQEVQRARDAAWEEIDNDTESARQQRAAVVADIPADLLSLYDKIRADRGGIGAVEIRQRRCEGCRITIDPADLARIRAAAPDAVLRCEECRRIQVRTAESGL